MGDDAFSRQDYQGAVRFYRRALELAKGTRWNEDALLLARAQLRSGAVADAEKTYTEYCKRNSGSIFSAGMFPGELKIALKDYAGAAQYFIGLSSASVIPEEQSSARFAAAAALAGAKEYLKAEALYHELEKNHVDSPEWAAQAHLGLIDTLIQSGQYARADKYLAERKYFRYNKEKYLYFELLLAVRLPDFNLFRTRWKALPADYDVKMRYQLAIMGAELAQRSPATVPEAAELLREAFKAGQDDDSRKHALRQLINVESVNSAEEGIKSISLYLKTWPDDPERRELLLRQARLLVSCREYAAANKVFDKLISDKDTPHHLRMTAMREAAVSAEYQKEFAQTEKILLEFLSSASGNIEREEALLLLGELQLKLKRNFRAEEYLLAALEQSGIRTHDIQFRLLQTLIDAEKFEKAAEIAALLGKASQGVHRAASAYYLAFIKSRSGEAAQARDMFLEFMKDFPWSGYVQPAMFHAAKLAFHDRKFKLAADEFLSFTKQYPDSGFNESALLLATQSACISQDLSLAEQIIAQYDKLLPQSAGRLEARLLLAEALYKQNRRSETIALLEKTRVLAKGNPVVSAEILYQYARIALAEEDRKQALAYLEEIVKNHASVSPHAADAAFIAGNLLADRGEYEKAEASYRKALELNPEGTFALLCKGRLADVILERCSGNPEDEQLKAAVELYRKLASAPDYRIRLQSCCKLGRVLEMCGDLQEAFAAYQEALYIAGNLKRQRLSADPVWTGKAAQAALNICRKRDFPDRAQHIKRITSQMRELGLPLDVNKIESGDQNKFTIQEK